MTCAWDELLKILPQHMRPQVDRLGRNTMQELRLRIGVRPELICGSDSCCLPNTVTDPDLRFVINTASRYSPWAAATAAKGYITAPGGHRIGICGQAVVGDGKVTAIREVTSLCIRVARDFPGIAKSLSDIKGNVLLLGPPGSGKTTLLRDLIRQISTRSGSVAVVDERGELFPAGIDRGSRTDILTGCTKADGVEMVLRTMSPAAIAVDEITARDDCRALMEAGWCGVRLLATAHAADVKDLAARPIYRTLWESRLFGELIVLRPDKSFTRERMMICP